MDAILSIVGERAVRRPPARTTNVGRTRRPLRVLLAEDNHVNRLFVTRVLEKRGHSVATAVNGKRALEAIERLKPRAFDLVLMDVQMPELDGLSAARRIRAAEESSGAHLPIVAMTAHALSGDRELCLAAGMDGYVAKPLHPNELIEVVERLGVKADSANGSRSNAAETRSAVFDIREAEARLGGDRRLLREMMTIFGAESPGQMTAIRRAAARKDLDRLQKATHALKGALGTLDAPLAFQAARRLEDVARRGAGAEVESALSDLEREMIALARALGPTRRPKTVKRKKASHGTPPATPRPRARRRR